MDRTGWASDVSESGLGFTARSLSVPTPGQRVQVMMELDDDLEWLVDRDAKVVRCDPGGPGLYSVGVELSQPFMD